MRVFRSVGDDFAFEYDFFRFTDQEGRAFDIVREVGLEEGEVFAREAGLRCDKHFREGLGAQTAEQGVEQLQSPRVVGSAGRSGERLLATELFTLVSPQQGTHDALQALKLLSPAKGVSQRAAAIAQLIEAVLSSN